MRIKTAVVHTFAALLLASCGGSSNPGETPASQGAGSESGAETEGEVPTSEEMEDLPPDACQLGAGVCAETTCEERGTGEIMGTCYLDGEPQTNLNCCASS